MTAVTVGMSVPVNACHFSLSLFSVWSGLHRRGMAERVEWTVEAGLQWAKNTLQHQQYHWVWLTPCTISSLLSRCTRNPSRISCLNAGTGTNVNRVISLIPTLLNFTFMIVENHFESDSEWRCCLQGGILRWTGLWELRGVSCVCLGPRSQKASCGGGWHHAEGLGRRR